jgi:hypothetical protein
MFSPPLVSGSSVRLDTILIYLIIPLYAIYKVKIQFLQHNLIYIKAFLVFFFSILCALFFQLLFFSEVHYIAHFMNALGFLRLPLFAIFSLIALTSRQRALSLAKVILVCVVIQFIILLVEYLGIYPFANIINRLYRDTFESVYVYRATGTFDAVHSAAYFFLYSFFFSLALLIGEKKPKGFRKLAVLSAVCSCFGILLPVSKGAFLAVVIGLLYFLIKRRVFGFLVILASLISLITITILYLLPTNKSDYIRDQTSILYEGIKWFVAGADANQYETIDFVAGRLDHGWKNAIDNWLNYPLTGNIDASQQKFIGDGGYTEILSNSGFIGLIGFLAMLAMIFFSKRNSQNASFLDRSVYLDVIKTFSICIVIASVATGFSKNRTIELLPVMVVVLSTLSCQNIKRI